MRAQIGALFPFFLFNVGSVWADLGPIESAYRDAIVSCGLKAGVMIEERIGDCTEKNPIVVKALSEKQWSLVLNDGQGRSFFRDDRSLLIWAPTRSALPHQEAERDCGIWMVQGDLAAALLGRRWALPSVGVFEDAGEHDICEVLEMRDDRYNGCFWAEAGDGNEKNYTVFVAASGDADSFFIQGWNPQRPTPFRCVLLPSS